MLILEIEKDEYGKLIEGIDISIFCHLSLRCSRGIKLE